MAVMAYNDNPEALTILNGYKDKDYLTLALLGRQLKRKMIIVIEESPKNFGWGSEIVASMAESGLANGKNIVRIGSEELPIPSSTLLEEKILPSINDVLHVIKTAGMAS